MMTQDTIYQKDIINEITKIPPMYFPNLLQMIRVFRETALYDSFPEKTTKKNEKLYPLRGMPFTYIDPTEPIAVEGWDVLK
jgi:hypothetical protein